MVYIVIGEIRVLKMKFINFPVCTKHFEGVFKAIQFRAHMHQHWTGEENALLFLVYQYVCPGVKIWTGTAKHQCLMSQSFFPD